MTMTTATTATTTATTASPFAYTFRVLNSDGTTFGTGCFTFEGDREEQSVQYTQNSSPTNSRTLTAFWYRDPIVGVLDLSAVLSLQFSNVAGSQQFYFNAWSQPNYDRGLVTSIATPAQSGAISAHRGATEDVSCRGRVLEWPALGQPTIETIEVDELTVPLVDLVVVIDSSVSMKDEAVALDAAVAAAIEGARSSCPSDLRVTYLGIEGTFRDTRFNETIRNYLTNTCQIEESLLRGRKRGTVTGGGAQEDGARAIEDLSRYFNWRTGAGRALFFLGDESLDGGNQDGKQDQGDIEAANVAIAVAIETNVRVHTYLGTSSVKEKVRKEIEAEYARLAKETSGQSFTSQDALRGFQALLQEVICGSKPAPKKIIHPFCCCQEYVAAQ
jgi:hypothetical protein